MTDSSSASLVDWVAALGTAGGFLAAAVGFIYDRHQRRKDERYAQAQLVDGWLGDPEFGERAIGGQSRATMKIVGYVSNASHAAVRDVRFEIRPGLSAESPVFDVVRADVGTVPPTRDDRPFPWSNELTAGVGFAENIDFKRSSLRGYSLRVRFTDTAGRRWVRHPDGRLEEASNVALEQSTELAELERKFPGYLEALQSSPTPEEALDKFRELKDRHPDDTQGSSGA